MTNQEKKQLKEIIAKIEDAQAEISLLSMQEQDRLDNISDSPSQYERATKLENNIENLDEAEETLGDAIASLEEIIS